MTTMATPAGRTAKGSAPSALEIAAAARFDELVGTRFGRSAPAAVLRLVDAGRWPSRPSGVPYAQSFYAVPANIWRGRIPRGARGFVQLFDRRGSYLAAWRGAVLPQGDWGETWGGLPSAVAGVPGYYQIDTTPLRPYLEANDLHDPFMRAPRDGADPQWLTQPLAQLAAELAVEAGVPLEAERAILAEDKFRPLDNVATRLAEARKILEASDRDVDAAALRLVKDAYTRGTAHLEFGKQPGHALYRPEWRHTIIDRHVANMFRSLRRSLRRPVAVGAVDSALFIVPNPATTLIADRVPGLPMGPELGAWQARGTTPLPGARPVLRKGPLLELISELGA